MDLEVAEMRRDGFRICECNAELGARLEWMTAQIDDLVFSRGRQELNDLERKARMSALEAHVEVIARKSSSAFERVQEIESCLSQHELRLQSVEAQPRLNEIVVVTPAAQSPPPPAAPPAVPRPVSHSATLVPYKSPVGTKLKTSETEDLHLIPSVPVVEKGPLQAIGLDPSVWSCAWIGGANSQHY